MGQCPKCSNPISSDFGLTNCKSCGETIFVGMDGEVQESTVVPVSELSGVRVIDHLQETDSDDLSVYEEDQNTSEETVIESSFAAISEIEYGIGTAVKEQGMIEEYLVNDLEDPSGGFEELYDEEGVVSVEEQYEPAVPAIEEDFPEDLEKKMSAVGEQDDAFGENSFIDQDAGAPNDLVNAVDDDEYLDNEEEGSDFLNQLESEDELPSISSTENTLFEDSRVEDLSDISRYGNSEISQGREGALLFTIIIDGIDSKDLKISVKECLRDKKFLWDLDSLLATLQRGRLVISEISAVKAAIILQRLKGLPVQVTWEQNAIFQA